MAPATSPDHPRNGLLAGRFAVLALAAALLPAAGAAPAVAEPEPAGVVVDRQREAFDAAFDEAFERYRLPGLAVGIVVDGEVVYRRTRGEREAGDGRAIDPATLFRIASLSKAMTAALLARLVDQGRLRWDDPVVKYLPHFRMHDDWVSGQIQVRDLLIHNSGLGPGAGDLMLWPEPNLFTREDVIRGLRHLKPLHSFRSRYAYDNNLYIVAGEVAAAAGGAPFDALVRREIFAPLGLDRCQVGAWQRDAVGNLAQPHMRQAGVDIVIQADGETIPDVPMMAAGGIRCSLDDMLLWARVWLEPERFGVDGEGRPWLSEAQREALWHTHMPMPLSRQMREWDNSHFSAYGYGWRLTDVDGTWKVSHTGTLSGMYSHLVLLPEKKAGIVFMANGGNSEARTVLPQVLLKMFTRADAAAAPTVAYYADWLAAQASASAGQAPGQPAPQGAAEPRAPAVAGDPQLIPGTYRDPWFGAVSICPRAGGFEFVAEKSPLLAGRVMRAGDRLLVDWHAEEVDAEAWLDFRPAASGQPATLTMAKVDPEADFSYDYEDLAFERTEGCPAP